jgi:hypothetical protein
MGDEPTDFNIKNYTIEDLVSIFDIDVVMSQGHLTAYLTKQINADQKAGKTNYVAFFTQGLRRLLLHYDEMIAIITGEESEDDEDNPAENVLKNEYYNDGSAEATNARQHPNRQNNISVADPNHSTQVRGLLSIPNTYNPSHVQGNLNPTLQNTYTTWVNVDSHYREIRKNTGSTSCTFNVASTAIDILDSSTDFTFNLSEPLTNVVSMTLGTMEIPINAYYPISEQYGTNSFDISCCGYNKCIPIKEGFYKLSNSSSISYDSTTLDGVINTDISSAFATDCSCNTIHMTVDPNTGKTTIKDLSASEVFDITFYSNTCKTDCSNNTCLPHNTGKKIDSNLGWLLGFRQSTYTNISGSGITSETLINPWGTRYLILEIDDLNRNRNSGNLVSMSTNQDKFSMPWYYKKTSQNYPVCPPPLNCNSAGIPFTIPPKGDPSGTLIPRSCRSGTPAGTLLIDGSNNLTKSQKYTITELMNARKSITQDRYLAPNTTNVLYRFPIPRSLQNHSEGVGNAAPLIIKNDQDQATRRYFGPVTLKILKVRLVNDKGITLDLNNMDFSFSLKIERLYQY